MTKVQSEIRTVKIDRIDLSVVAQVRTAFNETYATEVGEAYERGDPIPDPVVVETEDGALIAADGRHRIKGRQLAKRQMIQVEVHKGTILDAKLMAAGSNVTHGLRRSDSDRNATIAMLLNEPEWAEASSKWIASVVKCSDHTVEKVRSTQVRTCAPDKRVGRNNRKQKAHKGDAYEGDIFCYQCERARHDGLPAKADCPDCKTAREAQPAGSSEPNGRILFSNKAFQTAFGASLRQVDDLGRAFNCLRSPEMEGLRRLLKEWAVEFKKVLKELTKKGRA